MSVRTFSTETSALSGPEISVEQVQFSYLLAKATEKGKRPLARMVLEFAGLKSSKSPRVFEWISDAGPFISLLVLAADFVSHYLTG
jgi:hypothetical protein